MIEKAEKEDLKEILELQYLAYQSEARLFGDMDIPPLRQTLEEVYDEFQKGIILKEVDEKGVIIGSVRAYQDGGTVYIGKLMVHPEMQKKGIGTKLLLEIENEYPNQRYELFTSTKSISNIRLYERLGYKIFKEEAVSPELQFVYLEKKQQICMECYVDKNTITPLLNPLDCLENHTQYICGTCGRCICIEREPNRGLQRWNFPFKSLEIAKLYLRTADYSMKRPCGIYEIKSENGRCSYKIFAQSEDLQLYLKKNKGKTCENMLPVFMVEEYREYANTQIRKLTSDEIRKYMSEQ